MRAREFNKNFELLNRLAKVRSPNVSHGVRAALGPDSYCAYGTAHEALQRLVKRDGKSQISGKQLPFYPHAANEQHWVRPRRVVGVREIESVSDAIKKLPNPELLKPVILVGGGGYEVNPTPLAFEQDMEIIGLSRVIARQGDVAVQRLFYVMYPRDYFTDFFGHYFWNIAGARLLDKSDNEGTGGAVIACEKRGFLLMTHTLDDVAKVKIKNAYGSFVRVYEMPEGYALKKNGEYKGYGHLDYSIGFFEEAGVMLVDDYYWHVHEAAVVNFLESERSHGNDLKLVLVGANEKQQYPTNLLELYNGKVVMNYCPETLAKIRAVVSARYHDRLVMLDADSQVTSCLHAGGDGEGFGGGIRCLTNRYYPIADYLVSCGFSDDVIFIMIAWLNALPADDYQAMLRTGWSEGQAVLLQAHAKRFVADSTL